MLLYEEEAFLSLSNLKPVLLFFGGNKNNSCYWRSQPSHDLFSTFKAKMTSRNAKNHSDGRSHDTGNVATGKTSS